MFACENGHQGVVKLLLDYTLIIACKNGCKDVVLTLVFQLSVISP